MRYLADVNVLLALLHARHEHHRLIVPWLEAHAGQGAIGMCRVVQMALLRLLTARRVMAEEVMPPRAVWQVLDQLAEDGRFLFLDEPEELTPTWRLLCHQLRAEVAGTDVYLAALARASGRMMLTFDRGFERFRSVDVALLEV